MSVRAEVGLRNALARLPFGVRAEAGTGYRGRSEATDNETRPLRVAFIGQRGVPATFGGIEHHVEEIGSRLAARGHEVTVFCRLNYAQEHPAEYRGMHLRHLPAVGSKHLDAIVHSGLSTVEALVRRFDIVHYHALGPGLVAPLPRYLSRSKVVHTVHGLDDQRAKWGPAASAVLRAARWMSARVPDATIVVSRALVEEYASGRRGAVHIPNGVAAIRRDGPSRDILGDLGLEPRRYLLFVGRLVPEKAPDALIRSFRQVSTDMKLVVVGGTSYTDAFVDKLRTLAGADARVVLPGYLYGGALDDLYGAAVAFVLPSSLEGLPLTLLEAAFHGTPVVASAIPPHIEVLGEDGPGRRLFRPGDEAELTRTLELVLADPDGERSGATCLRDEVIANYSWDTAAAATEALYRKVLAGSTADAKSSVDHQPS